MYIISTMAGLDNAWLVVAERAQQAGKCLAQALADRKNVGQRPVTLIGHSMGARVIMYCLQELFALKEFHVVDDVILMGAPVTTRGGKWARARTVVSGRLINCYMWKDWILAFLYRYLEWGVGVAGLSEVKVHGVENYDLSSLGIKMHHHYPRHVMDILALVRAGERRPRLAPSPTL